MDRPHVKSCSTCGGNLPGRPAMRSPPPARRLAPFLLLVLLARAAEGRPDAPPRSAPAAGARTTELLEAVKAGILGSLGMEREPRPAREASEEELRSAYRSYWEKLREMGHNSSHVTAEAEQRSSVRPGELIKLVRRGGGLRSGRHVQWYRAVFPRSRQLQAELTLARAELKVSRRVLNATTWPPVGRGVRVKVKVGGGRRAKSAALVDTGLPGTEEARLDVSSEVGKWMRGDGRQRLVVDVGVAPGGNGGAPPTVSLELDLREARRERAPRSIKEDDCTEPGLCCRRSVTVSFKDIGWTDWVVAPAEYTMHFCDGACPHNYRPASMHTQVKSRLHQMTKGETPRPCCVPAAYEPMVLMHYDSRGKLKLTPFEDLIVSKCHCA